MPSPEPRGGHEAAGISRCSRWRGGGWPVAARAQQGERMRRIGIPPELSRKRSSSFRPSTRTFLKELEQSGWVVGSNIRIETRWATNNPTTFAAT